MKYSLKINEFFLYSKLLIISCLLMSAITYHCEAGGLICSITNKNKVLTYIDENGYEFAFRPIDELYKQYPKQKEISITSSVDIEQAHIILIQNEQTHEWLVLKEYKGCSLLKEEKFFKRVAKEAHFLKMLSGIPNIVDFKGLYYKKEEYPGDRKSSSKIIYTMYIAQEYAGGISLDKAIRKTGAMNEKKIHTYATQLISGLLSLKQKNILHKDLGMQNVMISNDDKIKIIDFGCSAERPKDSVHFDKEAIGYDCDIMSEYNHLAPELGKESDCEVTKTLGLLYPITLQADVWSFGSILYGLVTGIRFIPPITLNKAKTGIKLSFAEPEWKLISPGLKKLIKKCMVYDPAKRISIEEVAEDPWILQNFFRRM